VHSALSLDVLMGLIYLVSQDAPASAASVLPQ